MGNPQMHNCVGYFVGEQTNISLKNHSTIRKLIFFLLNAFWSKAKTFGWNYI